MLIDINNQNYKQQIRNDFNSRTNYDRGRFYELVGKRLVELAELAPTQYILDVATGTGIVALEAAEIVGQEGKVIGVDMSAGMLQTARQKLSTSGLTNVELIEADIEEISGDKNYFSDHSFDVIFCSLAICYLSNIPNFLKQCYRLLKPDGILAINAWEVNAFTPSMIFREVVSRYGVEIPNPNELLGSPQKCYHHVYESGFKNIKIFCEDFGWNFTPSLEYAQEVWQINSQNVFGYQVGLLPEAKRAECLAEYIQAIQALPTSENQARCNALLNFVIAKK